MARLCSHLLKTRETASLLRVHGRSRTERGLDGKDLASAYVLCTLDLAGPHISGLGRVDDIIRDQDQRFEVRDGGRGGVGVGVRIVAKMSKLCEEK
jgi:hypothetical protein